MKTILLIDDDDACRAPAAEILRLWNWNVIEAENGEQGVELAMRYRPDVILCDLLMPRGNGFHVCRTVRGYSELRNTRLIVLSGRDYAADREAAEDAGADEYLTKPVEFAKLRETLDGLTPPYSGEPSLNGDHVNGEEDEVMVRFWGVRGSIPTPGPSTVYYGGNTSCVEVRADGELIILDAGSGIRPLGYSLGTEYKGKPIDLTLLISHTHWDHIQGFPFFLPAYDPANRVRILGYEGARAGLAATLAGQMESPYFPIALKQMPGNILIEELREMTFRIGNVQVETCFLNHPGVCVGYRLNTSKGSIVYVPDNEPAVEKDPHQPDSVPRRVDSSLAAFVKDADVLVIDAQYDRAEYDQHIGWGHGCVDDVVQLAVEANVKQLYLFHHDPDHDDEQVSAMLKHARAVAQKGSSTLRVEAAREGDRVVLRKRSQSRLS